MEEGIGMDGLACGLGIAGAGRCAAEGFGVGGLPAEGTGKDGGGLCVADGCGID